MAARRRGLGGAEDLERGGAVSRDERARGEGEGGGGSGGRRDARVYA
jgi:hypothetical protein